MTPSEYALIPIDQIEVSPFQYRQEFDEAALKELAEDIRANGLGHPIWVRPIKKRTNSAIKYQLVAGERRLRAYGILGQKLPAFRTIPATVKAWNDIEAQERALAENLQREDVPDYAVAQALRDKMKLHAKNGREISEAELARHIKKSATFVRNHLRLFTLRPALQEVAREKPGVKSSLFEIQKVDDPKLEEELLEGVRGKLSYQAVKDRVDRHLEDKKHRRQSQTPDAPTREATASKSRRQREAEAEIKAKLLALRGNVAGIRSYWASAGKEFREENTPTLQELARLLNKTGEKI